VNRAYVDANVIVRLITGDPPDMAEQAERLFQRIDEGEIEVVVDSIVVAEVVWVLSSFYGFTPDEIAPALQTFLVGDGIVGEEKLESLQALALYREKNIDFVDALLAVRMIREGVRDIYSFDKHFDRLESVRRIEPT
jgi:predicted nucleic acid-binding protein